MKPLFEVFGEAALVGAAGWLLTYSLVWLYEQRRLLGMDAAEQRTAHHYMNWFAVIVGMVCATMFLLTQ